MHDLTLIPAIETTLPPVFHARHLIDGKWQVTSSKTLPMEEYYGTP